MGHQSVRKLQLKAQMAETAARLMNETGLRDYQMAKQKAAALLGISERKHWPTNQEIDQALTTYLSLFEAGEQAVRLKSLRQVAVDAMKFLEQFQPRLVGSVLLGNPTRHASVELHLFSEYPEAVSLYLVDNKMPFEEKDKRIRVDRDTYERVPVFKFIAQDVTVELIVFPVNGMRQAPLSLVDGKPMSRASLAEVEQLLACPV